MNQRRRFDRARFDELLADRALQGLDAHECAEFSEMLAAKTGEDLLADELAAAAADLAWAPKSLEPLPAMLRGKLLADAAKHFDAPGERASETPILPGPGSGAPTSVMRPSQATWAPWLAAAAALVVALIGWWPRLTGEGPPPNVIAEVEDAADARTVAFGPSTLTPDAQGAVVWSQSRQQGFVRVRGLPRNDATREQYQLWILDGRQENPIDGGVFDVTGDELVLAIDAKLAVAELKGFAITLERPGGVVVSKLDRLALIGQM
jgi:hypothetical protein